MLEAKVSGFYIKDEITRNSLLCFRQLLDLTSGGGKVFWREVNMSKTNSIQPVEGQALNDAIAVIERNYPPQAGKDPRSDTRRFIILQLHMLNKEALENAEFAQSVLAKSVATARKAVKETQARLDQINLELGIDDEVSDE
jgi:hypothetical protein